MTAQVVGIADVIEVTPAVPAVLRDVVVLRMDREVAVRMYKYIGDITDADWSDAWTTYKALASALGTEPGELPQ